MTLIQIQHIILRDIYFNSKILSKMKKFLYTRRSLNYESSIQDYKLTVGK